MLNLMYITNNTEIATIAESAGVQRIFIDMEFIGKDDRQGGMDTVQNHHTINDIRAVKSVLKTAKIIARCNPMHDATEKYGSSKEEIDASIDAGADILMLPYFKTTREVEEFIRFVDGRVKTMLLVETPEAVGCLDQILNIEGIDEIFIGLNDLSLGYGMKFMFQLLANGTVERLCAKFKEKGIPYGFGGIASIGKGLLPSEKIIAEHYRLGSTCAILSRSFCNTSMIADTSIVRSIFNRELKAIRNCEEKCKAGEIDFIKNKMQVKNAVSEIVSNIG